MLSDQEARRDQPIIAEFRQKGDKENRTVRGYSYELELWLYASERVPYAVGFWIGVVTVGHGFHERKTAISKVRLLRDVARRWLACVARS